MESSADIQSKRFKVALSFAGEQRGFVERVAERLGSRLGQSHVFYDHYYQAELARFNFDTYLTNIYLHESDLIVVFLSADYERKDWCGLEWRVVRDLIKRRHDADIMPFTFDGAIPEGMLSIDSYIEIGAMTPEETAGFILQRLDRQSASFRHRPPVRGAQNIPRSGAVAFVGRDAALERLDAHLRQDNRLAITAIAGMGGVGKTELAMQYAQRCWQDGAYEGGVCWLQARQIAPDGPGALDVASQIVAFVRSRCQVTPPEGLELRDQVGFCWRRWPSGDVLVVFDDVTDYALIEPYLPPTDPRFKVLITTRRDFGRSVASMTIDVLEPGDALSLLQNLVGSDRIEAELVIARKLCERLGYLPLGLELVGRYLAVRLDLELAQLQTRLESRGLRSAALAQREAGMTARLGVQAAFELSWEMLSVGAQRLGCLLSVLAEAPIPWSVVEACLSDVDAEALEDCRDEELIRLHLLQRHGAGVYRLHSLIRVFFQDKLHARPDKDQLRVTVGKWAASKARQIPHMPTRDQIEAVTLLIPHMAEVAAYLSDWVSNEDLLWPFVGVGRFYEGQGDYIQAAPWFQQCLSVVRYRLGDTNLSVADSLSNLALLYQSQGHYREAELLLRENLEMRKHLLGAVHPGVATSLNNLAFLYASQGRYNEAEPLYRDALEIWILFGEEHAHIADILNNLALLYQFQGRYDSAERLYLRALEMRKRLLGEEHAHIADSFSNLASLYQAQGRYDSAERLYLRALEMRKRLLGDTHPRVAASLNNLALLYRSQGRYNEAEPLLREDLEMSKRLLGDEHPDVATTLNNLALLHRSQGRYDEAEPLLREALVIRKRLLGDDHPAVAQSLDNLGGFYHSQGRYSEAEPLLREALVMRKRLLGDDHPAVAQSFNNLGEFYRTQGRYSEAEPLLRDALVMKIRLLGYEHPDVATGLNNLGGLYRSQGGYVEAEPLLLDALAMRKRLLGDDHPDVAQSLDDLGELYRSQGRYSEAEPLLREALVIRKRLLGDDHPDVAQSLNKLGLVFVSQGGYVEAEPLLLDAFEMRKRLLGDDHPDVAQSLNNLGLLYYSQNRYSEAEPLYRNALKMWKRFFGEAHPDVATGLNNLAFLYESQGRYSEAEPLLLETLKMRKRLLGDEHPSVAMSLNDLAVLYVNQGGFEKAAPPLEQALNICRKVLGAAHPTTQTLEQSLEQVKANIR